MYDAGSVISELCNPGSVAKLTQNSVIELLSIIFHFYFTWSLRDEIFSEKTKFSRGEME